MSFRHMHQVCLRHGKDHLAAVLIPLAVDGTILVASMSILLTNRYGSRGGFLAWTMLSVGSLASLGANIAVAEPSLIGRIIAAWPSAALIGSYELLMSQIRMRHVPNEGAAVAQSEATGVQELPGDDAHESSEETSSDDSEKGDSVEPPGGGPWRIAFLTGHSHRAGSSRSSSREALDGAAGSSESDSKGGSGRTITSPPHPRAGITCTLMTSLRRPRPNATTW
ncbi:DUF2637 domain-containing protein [Nonomuraea diastatica]|uniref:DUF2637 domain-containing protein n=1 Tax=Nonomuraea diastatica TaxID=1848329 RepID=UPI001FED22BF|nr:DUF2637 domain-containing protein [Nonomuraea diastatica]